MYILNKNNMNTSFKYDIYILIIYILYTYSNIYKIILSKYY